MDCSMVLVPTNLLQCCLFDLEKWMHLLAVISCSSCLHLYIYETHNSKTCIRTLEEWKSCHGYAPTFEEHACILLICVWFLLWWRRAVFCSFFYSLFLFWWHQNAVFSMPIYYFHVSSMSLKIYLIVWDWKVPYFDVIIANEANFEVVFLR